MKKLQSLLVLSIMVLLAIACNSTTTTTDVTSISGTIHSAQVDSVLFYAVKNGQSTYWDTVKVDGGDQHNQTFNLSKKGKEGFYGLYAARSYARFYLTPGRKLTFEQKKNRFILVNDISPENKKIQEWEDLYRPLQRKLSDRSMNYETRVSLVKQFLPKVSKFRKNINTPNKVFNTRMKYFTQAVVEARILSPLFGRYNRVDSIGTDLSLYEPLGDMHKFNKAPTLNLPNGYRWLQTSVNYNMVRDSVKNLPRKKQLEQAVSYIPNDTLKGLYIAKNFKHYGQYGSDFDAMMKPLQAYLVLPEFKKAVAGYKNIYGNLNPGEPGYNFTYKNIKGKPVSFRDLEGKYVFIDVWATWCGPCKAEIPYLKKIEKEFGDKHITFVSISVDSPGNRDKWKKFVKDKKLGGLQLLADNGGKSDIIKYYKIVGIPRFMLFDPEGNIINANAKRPSNPKLKTKLQSLL